MKFNWKLSRNENMDAWLEHSLAAPYSSYSALNPDEKAWLMQLNDTLRQLEEQYLPILDAKLVELKSRVANPADWLMDFNLDYTITFYLREDDPEYEEEDDNILMQITDIHFALESDEEGWGFGFTQENYAEQDFFPAEHHCYTYHQLYDHCHLDWRDLFRIDALYVDLKIEEQSGMLPVKTYSV